MPVASMPTQGLAIRPTGGRSATARMPGSSPDGGGGTTRYVGRFAQPSEPLRAQSIDTESASDCVISRAGGGVAPTVLPTVEWS